MSVLTSILKCYFTNQEMENPATIYCEKKHNFEYQKIKNWFIEHNNCPICTTEVEDKTLYSNPNILFLLDFWKDWKNAALPPAHHVSTIKVSELIGQIIQYSSNLARSSHLAQDIENYTCYANLDELLKSTGQINLEALEKGINALESQLSDLSLRMLKMTLIFQKTIRNECPALFHSSKALKHIISQPPFVSWDAQTQPSYVLIGGKASNLLKLQKLVSVPRWFCISSIVFYQFLVANQLWEQIVKLDSLSKDLATNQDEILILGEEIQKKISRGTFKEPFLQELKTNLMNLESQIGKENIRLAVRSSGIAEDLKNASFAGLYDTKLNRNGFEDICASLKEVWASAFNHRLILERTRLQIPQTECLMAVIIQDMVNSRASGTASTVELSTGYPGVEIAANYGMGESVVSGDVSTDKWLVHPQMHYIIKSFLGEKQHIIVPSEGLGTETKEAEVVNQICYSLSQQEVVSISKKLMEIRNEYGVEVESEFAIDKFTGNLYFVQVRPLVQVSDTNIMVVDPKEIGQHRIVASGQYSVRGVVHGTLKFVPSWEDLVNKEVSITPDDIVLTYMTSHTWSPYLRDFKGLITKRGSPTAHPILLCRERGVPCLIEIGAEFDDLLALSGKKVTLDGINRLIYEGEVPLKTASQEDFKKEFESVQVKPWPSDESRITYFSKANLLIFHDGNYWLKTPPFRSKLLHREMNLKRDARLAPLAASGHPCHVETQIVDGFVCNRWDSFETIVQFFDGMNIEQCQDFSKRGDQCLKKYEDITANFKLDPDMWQDYTDTFIDSRAYVWLGGSFRGYTERKMEELASSLGVPQYYLEECSAAIQSTLTEEDTLMQLDIYQLASKMISLPKFDSVFKLQAEYSEIGKEIEILGRKYRFNRDTSIEIPLDLNLVYQRLLQEVDQIKEGKTVPTRKNAFTRETFFPEQPDLLKWLTFSIYNRVYQSNTSHIHIRGQWKVREELLKLGKHLVNLGKLKSEEEIFDCSIDQIKEFIIQHQSQVAV